MFSFAIMKIDKLLRALHKHFPLKEVSKVLSEIGITVPIKEFKKIFPHAVWFNGKLYLPPTLEQLFTALGKRFYSIGRDGSKPSLFFATAAKVRVTGKSPLEALIKLFLALK